MSRISWGSVGIRRVRVRRCAGRRVRLERYSVRSVSGRRGDVGCMSSKELRVLELMQVLERGADQ